MSIENGLNAPRDDKDQAMARRIKPEMLRDEASKTLIDNLVRKLTSSDIDLRNQTGGAISLNQSEDIGVHINSEGNLVLSQEVPDSGIEQITTGSDARQQELAKKMGAEKMIKFAERMSEEKKDKYLEELADKQMSYHNQLEEAERALKEAGAPKEKTALEKKVVYLRDRRDGYNLIISAIEQGTADIKKTEFKSRKKLEQEIIIPQEITKATFDAMPERLQKKYVSGLEEAIDAGEEFIREYKAVLETGDITDAEKKEAQRRIREEQAEIETKKKLIENLK